MAIFFKGATNLMDSRMVLISIHFIDIPLGSYVN